MTHSQIISIFLNCGKKRDKELHGLNILTICDLKLTLCFFLY